MFGFYVQLPTFLTHMVPCKQQTQVWKIKQITENENIEVPCNFKILLYFGIHDFIFKRVSSSILVMSIHNISPLSSGIYHIAANGILVILSRYGRYNYIQQNVYKAAV